MSQERPAWADRLQAEREGRSWSKHEMARQLLRAAGLAHGSVKNLARQILDWEKGRHFPRDWAAAYSTAFGLDKDRLFFEVSPPHLPSEDDEEMERRKLLQALAALGVAPTPALEALESIRGGVDRTLGRDDSNQLAEWEETVAEYGYTYMSLPPHRLVADLADDLVMVQQTVARKGASSPEYKDWCRVTSGLSMLLAKTLCNLGQPRHARRWWQTAQQAADRSGDTNLSLWVSGEQLVHGIYDKRPTPILLRRANEAAARHAAPCRGLAPVQAARAQLYALDGQADQARSELQRTRDLFEQLPHSVTTNVRSHAGWGEGRLRYTEAWVYAHLGADSDLDRSVSRAHDLLPMAVPRMRAQVNLLRAVGHVRTGDVTEGVRHAVRVYEAHPAEQRGTMFTSLASQVVDDIPPARRDEPVVTAYRELLSSDSGRKAIK